MRSEENIQSANEKMASPVQDVLRPWRGLIITKGGQGVPNEATQTRSKKKKKKENNTRLTSYANG